MKTFYSHLDRPGRGTTIDLFQNFYKMQEVLEPNDADIIIWNGGEDIATSIYSEQPVRHNIPFKMSNRDIDEIALFNEYKDDTSKFLFGICRGAQLLNCLNGGKLYQDVNGHHMTHDMLDLMTGEVLRVTSTHHQQMIANNEDGRIIGVSSCSTYKDHESGPENFVTSRDLRHGADVEIIWYPKTRSLAIQGHPEYVPTSPFAAYTYKLIQKFFNESIQKVAA